MVHRCTSLLAALKRDGRVVRNENEIVEIQVARYAKLSSFKEAEEDCLNFGNTAERSYNSLFTMSELNAGITFPVTAQQVQTVFYKASYNICRR